MIKRISLLIFTLNTSFALADQTSIYACKSTVEYSAMSLVDQGMDILSPTSAPYKDQSRFQLSEGQVRVRIVVDEDQAGYHLFGATVAYSVKRFGAGLSYRCEVTDLQAL